VTAYKGAEWHRCFLRCFTFEFYREYREQILLMKQEVTEELRVPDDGNRGNGWRRKIENGEN